MSQSIVAFQSSILRLALSPDSRGYVLFSLWILHPESADLWTPLTSQDVLTCEYLTDLITVAVEAAKWITVNCIDIKSDEGRHIYYQFKELPDVRIIS
jgi:hypothetical protein